ncbi:glycosyltransferase family 4 protein [Halobacillus mangrovi]|uniref:glycosyltransferase family 4 protein n=1 Tax=Halobacillus mangrovi TaxID=402384 RepID=UPI003D99832A
MTKKILIVSQNFYPEIGSAGNRIKNIYLLLKESGYDVDVLTTDPTYPNRKFYEDESFWDHEELNETSDVTRIKIRNRKYSRSFSNRLFYYLEMASKMVGNIFRSKKKYDYVFTTSPPIFIAVVGLLAKYKFGAKLILDIRDLWPDSLKGVGVFNYPFIINFFHKIEKVLYRKANEIIVNSQGFIDHITAQEENVQEKMTYVPNAAREHEISQSKSDSESFKAIYAGNLGLAQDNEMLLHLAERMKERNVKLTIMGYGYYSHNLKYEMEGRGLDNVNFVHPRTRNECFKLISEHQVGIVTLVDKDVFKTVLPGKIIDYMTCGVPIVGSVSGFSKQVIEDEDAGFVSETKDADDLIGYVDRLKNDALLQKRMSKNGTKYVREHFLWENNIQSLLNLMEARTEKVPNKLRKVEL